MADARELRCGDHVSVETIAGTFVGVVGSTSDARICLSEIALVRSASIPATALAAHKERRAIERSPDARLKFLEPL